MRPVMRTMMLLLALAGASAVAGCHVSFGSVDLDRVEHPRDWGGGGGRGPNRAIDR